jgi:hypothetical protein
VGRWLEVSPFAIAHVARWGDLCNAPDMNHTPTLWTTCGVQEVIIRTSKGLDTLLFESLRQEEISAETTNEQQTTTTSSFLSTSHHQVNLLTFNIPFCAIQRQATMGSCFSAPSNSNHRRSTSSRRSSESSVHAPRRGEYRSARIAGQQALRSGSSRAPKRSRRR